MQVKGTGGGRPSRSWESCHPAGTSVLQVDNYCHHGNRCSTISSATPSMSGMSYFEVCPLCRWEIFVRDRHTKDEAWFKKKKHLQPKLSSTRKNIKPCWIVVVLEMVWPPRGNTMHYVNMRVLTKIQAKTRV